MTTILKTTAATYENVWESAPLYDTSSCGIQVSLFKKFLRWESFIEKNAGFVDLNLLYYFQFLLLLK